jgi:hypothetical protein
VNNLFCLIPSWLQPTWLQPLKLLCWLLALGLAASLAGCSLPQVKAEDRLFLPLSLEFLGSYQLPKQEFQGTKLGGLSGLTYDRQLNQLYAISDDRSNFAPARFYTIQLTVNQDGIQAVSPQAVTTLKDKTGNPYPAGSLDPEGIALSPRQSLLIASEGDTETGVAPFIDEFDLKTGVWRGSLPIPKRYLPNPEKTQGVQNNRGFESLTLSAISSDAREPFRLFAAIESSLQQDLPVDVAQASPQPAPQLAPQPKTSPSDLRFMHYLVGETQTLLLSEHLYRLEPPPEGSENLGLTDLLWARRLWRQTLPALDWRSDRHCAN